MTTITTSKIKMTVACAAVVAGFCLIAPALTSTFTPTFALAAWADEAMPDNDHGRYTFTKAADGVLRLDTQTGIVSTCTQRTVGWACQAAPDDRAALEDEIARLRTENGALKKELLAHGLTLPSAGASGPQASPDGDVIVRLPSDADVDRAVAYVGRMWQRFVDAIARAQKQMLNKS